MRKKLSYSIIALLLLSGAPLRSQNIRFTHLWNHTNISFDLNQLYNYNLYEQNRWGGGFNLTTPLHYDSRYGIDFQNLLSATIYGAYGTGDHAWKYGGGAELRFPRSLIRSVGLNYRHDLDMAGRHSFDSYNILNTTDNSTYFSSRYSMVDRLTAGLTVKLPGKNYLTAEYRHSGERLLFNATNLMYPAIYDADALAKSYYDEAHLRLDYGDHWRFDLLAGHGKYNDCGPFGGITKAGNFWRLVAQYQVAKTFSGNKGSVNFFAQGGTTGGANTPLSRRFDLSGTGSSFYYFNNTLLTVRPNTFMADAFLFCSFSYTMAKPLWNLNISHPTPFVQLNAVWGTLYGDHVVDGSGIYELMSGNAIASNEFASYNGLPSAFMLTAPSQGLLEPVVGLDKLLRWGVLDLGVAAAYQLTPKNAPYHLDNFLDKFSVMCIAKLVLDLSKHTTN